MRRKGRVEGDYEPQKHVVPILDAAMAHIKSVPYRVTLRWVFYRLLQDGFYKSKQDYNPFRSIQAKARKCFYQGWRPDTFDDDTRSFIERGDGFDDLKEWMKALARIDYKTSIWQSQKYYVELWFEAGAMIAQFEHYAPEVPLFAFHGDCSIAPKWEAAKRLESAAASYGLPIVVYYFGDEDEKGLSIPESAVSDIRQWCQVPFKFVRAGLNLGDGRRLGLQESIDKPGAFQWEALSDEQARNMIESAVFQHFDVDAANDLRDGDENKTQHFQKRFQRFIEDWEDHD